MSNKQRTILHWRSSFKCAYFKHLAHGVFKEVQWSLVITNHYITKSSVSVTNNFLYARKSKIYGQEPRYNETSL